MQVRNTLNLKLLTFKLSSFKLLLWFLETQLQALGEAVVQGLLSPDTALSRSRGCCSLPSAAKGDGLPSADALELPGQLGELGALW